MALTVKCRHSAYFSPICLNQSEDSLNNLPLSVTASIFAYGQTSSGKTYTMTGITECTVSDIYDYIGRVIKHILSSGHSFGPNL